MDIILLLKTVLLGIVEGITEWLPISSTGHLILADEFIKLNMTGAFKEMFDVVIQLGAIMAVVVLYFHKLNPFSPKKNHREKMESRREDGYDHFMDKGNSCGISSSNYRHFI